MHTTDSRAEISTQGIEVLIGQSGLVEAFRTIYPDTFAYEGKRAIVFDVKDRLPVRALGHCIALALTHHLRKKTGSRKT